MMTTMTTISCLPGPAMLVVRVLVAACVERSLSSSST